MTSRRRTTLDREPRGCQNRLRPRSHRVHYSRLTQHSCEFRLVYASDFERLGVWIAQPVAPDKHLPRGCHLRSESQGVPDGECNRPNLADDVEGQTNASPQDPAVRPERSRPTFLGPLPRSTRVKMEGGDRSGPPPYTKSADRSPARTGGPAKGARGPSREPSDGPSRHVRSRVRLQTAGRGVKPFVERRRWVLVALQDVDHARGHSHRSAQRSRTRVRYLRHNRTSKQFEELALRSTTRL